MYTYDSAGLVLGKRLDLYRGVNTLTVSNTQAYDNEGKLTTFTVPYGSSKSIDFDSMGRPSALRETDNSQTWANGTTYNAAGQLTAMTIGPSVANWAQTNTYNVLGQLTRRTISSVIDFEYTFPATTNNGQIEKLKDHITGEEVNYAYDALQRLVTAQTTGPDWGLSFGYDGFGNKLSQTVTKGTAPAMSITVNSSNQVTGQTYDANGNMTAGASSTLTYDVDNRIATATGLSSEWYGYAPDNKRVWKKRLVSGSTYEEVIYFYAGGAKLVALTLTDASGTLSAANKTRFLYFGGQMILESDFVAVDRLGSIRFRRGSPGTRHDYWPYGEEKPSATAQGMEKFATYERDHTGLDYADQRYFTDTAGRFVTPDPARDGMNWYAYAGGDPVNKSDPTGLCDYSVYSSDCWNPAGGGGGWNGGNTLGGWGSLGLNGGSWTDQSFGAGLVGCATCVSDAMSQYDATVQSSIDATQYNAGLRNSGATAVTSSVYDSDGNVLNSSVTVRCPVAGQEYMKNPFSGVWECDVAVNSGTQAVGTAVNNANPGGFVNAAGAAIGAGYAIGAGAAIGLAPALPPLQYAIGGMIDTVTFQGGTTFIVLVVAQYELAIQNAFNQAMAAGGVLPVILSDLPAVTPGFASEIEYLISQGLLP